MKRFRKLLVAAAPAAILVIAPVTAHAESLYAAMANAYANNPDLNAARAGLRATDEGVAIAKSGYRPIVSATGTVTYTNTEGNEVRTAAAGISVSQTLFDGFQTLNNIRAAEASVFAGRENLRGTEIDILLATAQAYTWHTLKHAFAAGRGQKIPARWSARSRRWRPTSGARWRPCCH